MAELVWSLKLYAMASGREYAVHIEDGYGHVVKAKGRTPQEAHRRAEIQLVIKPWVCAESFDPQTNPQQGEK